MSKYAILWDTYVLLGVDNISANAGHYNSVIVKARKNRNIILMGCPCHITRNAAKKVH